MNRSDDLGKLVLRLALGILMLLHGIAKMGKGVDGIGGMLAAQGLPAALAYGAYIGEVLAPALVIIGWMTRPAAALIAINMVVAIWLAHAKQLTQFTNTGGWALELQGMFLFTAVALMLMGGGRFGVGGKYS